MNRFNRLVKTLLSGLLSSLTLIASQAIAQDATTADRAVAAHSELPPSLSQRYQQLDSSTPKTAPDFQRHIGPLLGRLGCNGRACHGSFQGRGDFQLSLFGYDFLADHLALNAPDTGRIDSQKPEDSLILAKPTDADQHEGGKRMDVDSWQYRAMRHWIAAGAPFSGKLHNLKTLEVHPQEIIVHRSGEKIPLRAIAHWEDGTIEDVTELCRFSTNDDVIAEVSEEGVVTSHATGDTHVVVAYDKAVVPVAVMQPTSHNLEQIERPRESTHPIDRLVQTKLDKLGIVPSSLCNDSDFIRRATLDITGLLPAPERVTAFLQDTREDKRQRLIDELLEQPGYAAWWAVRLSDWTGNNEVQMNNVFPVRGAASRYWYAWIEKRLEDNVPYDEIVEGLVDAESRLPGESYLQYCQTMSAACREGDDEAFASRPGVPQFWARNNFRLPEDRAVGFAYSFLGIRIQCAQCHKHPFDQWSKQDFDKFAVLFSSIQANPNSLNKESREIQQKLVAEVTRGRELRGGDLRKEIAEAAQRGQTVPFPELIVVNNFRKREPVNPTPITKPAPAKSNEPAKSNDPAQEDSDMMMETMSEMTDDNMMDAVANSGDNPSSDKPKKDKDKKADKSKADKASAKTKPVAKAKPAAKSKPTKKKPTPPVAKGSILGEFEEIALVSDPRDALMSWLRRPDNPYFAKAIVNRVWANYFGIGIVNPVDDMNLGNPPSNQALLDYLAEGFIANGYDLKWLHREITTSDTYQRSSTPNLTNVQDTRNFSRHIPHRLPAEVVRDAIYLATIKDETAQQSRQSLDKLAISGLVGGYAKQGNREFALQVFGQSVRESNCDCDRSDQSNLLQSIYLQNDTDIHRQLSSADGWVNVTTAAYGPKATPTLDSKPDRHLVLAKELRTRAIKQYERLQQLPEKKQDKSRADFEQELKRINERLTKLGQPEISVDQLAEPKQLEPAVAPEKSLNTGAAIGQQSRQIPAEASQWVDAAYLRTLSRYPDPDEMRISLEFIQQSDNPQTGLRSVMWALLNTKEFLLSH